MSSITTIVTEDKVKKSFWNNISDFFGYSKYLNELTKLGKKELFKQQFSKGQKTIAKRQLDHKNACLQAYDVKMKTVRDGKGNNTESGIPLVIQMEKGVFVSNPCFK